MNVEKALDRAAKLQAQMESEAELGNEAAAQSFAAAMSRLVLEHALHQDDIAAHRAAGTTIPEEPVIERPVDLQRVGVQPKNARNANLEELAQIVGKAHLCRILVRPGSNNVWFVGTARHVEVSEYMLATMWRALSQLAKQGRRDARRLDATVNLDGYGQSFKANFLSTLRMRYTQEQDAVIKEQHTGVVDTSTFGAPDGAERQDVGEQHALMCLRASLKKVDAYVDTNYSHKRKARAVSSWGRGSHNATGARDGQAAATRMNLRANALNSGLAPRRLNA